MIKSIYEVKDIKEILGIGLNQAYDLVKENHQATLDNTIKDKFPVRKIGNNYKIPIKPFDDWVNCVHIIEETN